MNPKHSTPRDSSAVANCDNNCGEKMSKDSVPAGNIYALLARFSEFKQKAFARTGKILPDEAISGVNREVHAPFWEKPPVKLLRPGSSLGTSYPPPGQIRAYDL